MKRQQEHVVYQYQGSLSEQEIKVPKGLAWKWITADDLAFFFADDVERQRLFGDYLANGYLGVLLHQEERWLSYGWMSTPSSPPPPPVPVWVKHCRPFWLFAAFTRAEERGRGYHKVMMQVRIRRALTNEREIGPIFVDLDWGNENFPADAIERTFNALCFRPCGLMAAREFASIRLERVRDLEIAVTSQANAVKQASPSPLFLEGWQEFNKLKWGLQPVRVRFEEDKLDPPTVETIFYLTKQGKLRQPPGNAYLPLHFQNEPNTRYDRTYKQWVEMAGRLAEEMLERGLSGALGLPPNITDVRPWQWAGFRVGVKYTLITEAPYSLQKVSSDIRNRARKALKNGYACERTTNFRDVLDCIEATSQRQEFQNHLTLADLHLARELLGDEHFCAYVCYAPDGEPASAQIRLHARGHKSLGLEAGNKERHLSYGVHQLLTDFAMSDLERAGATGFDFAGANIKQVAVAKVEWNAQLVPYYTIETHDLRSFAKWARQGWKIARERKRDQ